MCPGDGSRLLFVPRLLLLPPPAHGIAHVARSVKRIPALLNSDRCGASHPPIASAAACLAAVRDVASAQASLQNVSDPTRPSGCLIAPVAAGGHSAIWNSATSASSCAALAHGPLHLAGTAALGSGVSVSITHDGSTANISLTGPAASWFGIGFGASAMKDLPYALIVDGTGKVGRRVAAAFTRTQWCRCSVLAPLALRSPPSPATRADSLPVARR